MISSKLSDRIVARASPRRRGHRSRRRLARTATEVTPGHDRRGFLARVAVVGSALAVNPLHFVLKPGTRLRRGVRHLRRRLDRLLLHDQQRPQLLPAGQLRRRLVEGRQRRLLLRRRPLHHRLQRHLPDAVRVPLLGRRLRRPAHLLQPVPLRPVPPGDLLLRPGRVPRRDVHPAVAVRPVVHDARARPTTPPAPTAHPASPTTASPTSSGSTGRWAAPTARSARSSPPSARCPSAPAGTPSTRTASSSSATAATRTRSTAACRRSSRSTARTAASSATRRRTSPGSATAAATTTSSRTASIYVGPAGTHAVAGGFRDKLEQHRRGARPARLPDARGHARPPGASARYQLFETGSMWFSWGTGVHWLKRRHQHQVPRVRWGRRVSSASPPPTPAASPAAPSTGSRRAPSTARAAPAPTP